MTENTIPALEARNHLGEIIKRSVVNGDCFIVEKSGIPMVAIINVQDYEEFKQLMAERENDFEMIERLRSKMPDMAEEEIHKLVNESVAAVRKKKNA